MTLKELREEILNTKHPEWFKEQAVLRIEIPYLSISQEIKGFVAAYKFIDDQVNGFEKISIPLPNVLSASKQNLNSIQKSLVTFFNDYKQNDVASINNIWAQVQSRIRNILTDINHPTFLIDFPGSAFLLELHGKYPESVGGAVDFLVKRPISGISDPNNLLGVIMAYEFTLNDGSGILDRRKKESASLNNLKSNFTAHTAEAEQHLQEFLINSKAKTENDAKAIDEFVSSRRGKFDDWFGTASRIFSDFDDASKKRMKELEHTYQEKLRLAKPAEYWNKRAGILKKEGQKWLVWLGVLTAVATVSLFVLLWQIPDGMLLNLFDGDANAIKWTIVYVTYLSFIAFGIRTLAKVTFSSFHLARDAEEREQLTYVYLALMEEAKINEGDRSLIMQALFSRADTGLLKEDSSPTMPGIIDKVMSR